MKVKLVRSQIHSHALHLILVNTRNKITNRIWTDCKHLVYDQIWNQINTQISNEIINSVWEKSDM